MVVIYAEKSSLAKTIAGVLHAGQRIPLNGEPTVGYYQFRFNGEDAVLCHGVGHLMQLVPAKHYDAKYSKWDLSVFPCIPEQFRIAPKNATIACAKLVKSFLSRADWVINATDPDREGELIFSYVYQACNCHAPVMRAWIEDLTDAKIRKAFQNLIAPNQPISTQNPGTPQDLQLAGRARDIADWLIGNNLTVAATKKFGNYEELLSVGRVQTPTLALVVKREKEIREFVKSKFWRLLANFTTRNQENFEAEYSGGKFDKIKDAQKMLALCGNAQGILKELTTTRKMQSAPLLYNATQLQISANKIFGWNADKTSKIMQMLYEKKLMTYPRTSSEHLTSAMMPETAQTIGKILQMPEYSRLSIPQNQWQKFTKRHFDDNKVGSHPAIIPTVNVPQNLSGLSSDEKALYDLLAKSLIRIIYPKVVLDDTEVLIDVNQVEFKATGTVLVNAGWYAVDNRKIKKMSLPLMQKGEILNGEYFIREGETQPPERYTEATLLSAMELAGQHIEDEEIRTLMKMQKKGLGTDATRAPILKGLFDKNYLTLQGKTIFPTDKGIFLIDTLPIENIKSADMTGDWEMRLNQIAIGKADYSQFIREISQVTREWFSAVANAPEQHFSNGTQIDLSCPNCGKSLTRLSTVCKCPECQFHMSTYICKVRLSEEIILQLLKKGRSHLMKGFQSKNGKKFNAYLVLNQETGEITFDFTSEQEKNLHCPFCNSSMNKMRYSYQCGNPNCGFKINSEICKKKLTVSQISAILTKGQTPLIKGFKSKAGKSFSAMLYLDKADRQIKFNFPDRKT
ncbi:MAG: DNA topoisomerase [Oscillospiraceae bacterium]